MQADVFRIAYLLRHDGVWVDAATHLKSLWGVGYGPSLVLIRRQGQKYPEVAGFIYASAGHPLLARAWDRISAYLLHRSGTKVYAILVQVLRDLMREPSLASLAQVLAEQDVFKSITFGSSRAVLGRAQHWSSRQETESFYFSDG